MTNQILTIARSIWNKFWFNNPCAVTTVTGEDVASYLRELLAMPSNIRSGVLLKDHVLSRLLGYHVLYLRANRFQQLKNDLQKMDGYTIERHYEHDRKDIVLKFQLVDEVFVIAAFIDVVDSYAIHQQSSIHQASLNCRLTNKQIASFDSEEFGILDEIYRRERRGGLWVYDDAELSQNPCGENDDITVCFK